MRNKDVAWLRPTLFLGGLTWLSRAAIEFAQPNYYNPRTLLDYSAVISTTLAYLFLAAVLWGFYLQHTLVPGWKRSIWIVGMILTIMASSISSLANFAEDAMGLKSFGELFFFGGVSLMLGLLLSTIGAFLNTEIQYLGWFLLACMVGIAFPDNGGWYVMGAAFLIYWWVGGGRNGGY